MNEDKYTAIANAGDITYDTLTNAMNIYNGSSWNNVSISNIDDMPKASLKFEEDATIQIGDDFVIEASHLKACLKVLLKMAKEDYAEEFI